jgi:hypothetical protein
MPLPDMTAGLDSFCLYRSVRSSKEGVRREMLQAACFNLASGRAHILEYGDRGYLMQLGELYTS